jgi:hypothetical protein
MVVLNLLVMPYLLLLPHLLNVKSPGNTIPTTATAHTFEFSQVTSSVAVPLSVIVILVAVVSMEVRHYF